MIFYNPVWQGGGDFCVYDGAEELRRMYLGDIAKDAEKFCKMPVPADGAAIKAAKQRQYGIRGFAVLRRQLDQAMTVLRAKKPGRIFTLGAGCDSDVASILYLNEMYSGKLLLLWMDGHGDLNSPDESSSGLFFGMPARAVQGGCRCITIGLSAGYLKPGQHILLGGRDLDPAEVNYIRRQEIPVLDSCITPEKLTEKLRMRAAALCGDTIPKLYIHLDLDVLEPSEFSNTPLPVPGGMHTASLMPILETLREQFPIAGMSLSEYLPAGEKIQLLQDIIHFGISVQ